MSGLKQLYPFAGNNAIESAVFLLEWEGGRDLSLNADALTLSPQLQRMGFGAPSPVQVMTVTFGVGAAGMEANENAGHQFLKKGPNQSVLREVSIRDNQFLIIVRDYFRWDKVWGDVSSIFSAFTPILVKHNKRITNVTLQYVDKFQWKSRDQPFPVREVLRTSPMMAENVFSAGTAWHSHHGYFHVPTKTDWTKTRLDNVNISLQLENDVPTLAILTLHQYKAEAGVQFHAQQFFEDTLAALFSEAHMDNKTILSQLLSEEVCSQITLEAPKQ